MKLFGDIDYARRRQWPAWFAPGLLVLLAAMAWGASRYLSIERHRADLRSQLNNQRQLLASKAARPIQPAPSPPKERVKSVNEAIAALNVPWPALLGAIESARPGGVALMRIEPRPKDQIVLVTAQADDMAALIDFMEKVSQTEPFVKVLPVRQEQLLDAGLPRKQATFEARWEERR